MAIKANILVDQGTTFSTTITVTDDEGTPLTLTNYSGAAQMRKHYTSSNATSFSVSVNNSTGEISLALTANQTSNLVAGRYVYDVELTDANNVVSRIVEGIVTVTPQVTR